MYVLVYAIVAFVLVKQFAELVHVELMERVQFLCRRLLVLLHTDWPPNWKEDTYWYQCIEAKIVFSKCNPNSQYKLCDPCMYLVIYTCIPHLA